MSLGCSGMMEHYYRFLLDLVHERPSMMLVFWTAMTVDNFDQYFESDCGELPKNILYNYGDQSNIIKKIGQHIG